MPNVSKPHRYFHLVLLAHIALMSLFMSCAVLRSPPTPEKPDAASLSQTEYWLSQSLYGGPFYDHDQLRLMDPRPFHEIKEVQTLDGYVLLPPKEDEVIPIGTKVRLQKTVLSTPTERLKRPIYSPKFSTWAYLFIASERGAVNIYREKPYILLIPESITTREEINQFLSQFLSLKDPTPWFLEQREFIQKAILEKRPTHGMDKKQLFAALGRPLSVIEADQNTTHGMKPPKIYNYDDYIIKMEQGRVSQITKKSPSSSSR